MYLLLIIIIKVNRSFIKLTLNVKSIGLISIPRAVSTSEHRYSIEIKINSNIYFKYQINRDNLNSKEIIYFQEPITKLYRVPLLITGPPPINSATEIDTNPNVMADPTFGCLVLVCSLKQSTKICNISVNE